MGRVSGKVALITGAARGQGRSHAELLAREGADIAALDIAAQSVASVNYPLATKEDLAATAAAVEAADRRCLTFATDARDQCAVDHVVAATLQTFGRLDTIVINHGIDARYDAAANITEAEWRDQMDVNLTGVWHVAKATIPALIEGKRGGSIIITSSAAGLLGLPGMLGYTAAKSAMVGMMRSLANELAQHSIFSP